jgi:hypothetical protein
MPVHKSPGRHGRACRGHLRLAAGEDADSRDKPDRPGHDEVGRLDEERA